MNNAPQYPVSLRELNKIREDALQQANKPERERADRVRKEAEDRGASCARFVIAQYPKLLAQAATQGRCGVDFVFDANDRNAPAVITAERVLRACIASVPADERPSLWFSHEQETHRFIVSICMRPSVPLYDMSQLENEEPHQHNGAEEGSRNMLLPA